MSKQKGCLAFFFPFLNLVPSGDQPSILPYKIRDDFLSPAELSFYKVLALAVEGQAIVLAKIGLKDIFFVNTKGDKRAQATFQNKINIKHVDFLLCARANLRPLCGVELDDKSHLTAKRLERDQFVDAAFSSAGLPLIHFHPHPDYAVQQILEILQPHITAQPAPITKVEPNPDPDIVPLCPKCNLPMVRRTAKNGTHHGQPFYGCSNFPRCRETNIIKEDL